MKCILIRVSSEFQTKSTCPQMALFFMFPCDCEATFVPLLPVLQGDYV